jgi:hypothetical protein
VRPLNAEECAKVEILEVDVSAFANLEMGARPTDDPFERILRPLGHLALHETFADMAWTTMAVLKRHGAHYDRSTSRMAPFTHGNSSTAQSRKSAARWKWSPKAEGTRRKTSGAPATQERNKRRAATASLYSEKAGRVILFQIDLAVDLASGRALGSPKTTVATPGFRIPVRSSPKDRKLVRTVLRPVQSRWSNGIGYSNERHLPSTTLLRAPQNGSMFAVCSKALLHQATRATSPGLAPMAARTSSLCIQPKLRLLVWTTSEIRKRCAIDRVETVVHGHRACCRG